MKRNLYKKWIPTADINDEALISSIIDNRHGLEIKLKTMNNDYFFMLHFNVEDILFYKNINESYLLSHDMHDEDINDSQPYEDIDDSRPWSFFMVESSDLTQWFLQVSLNLYYKKDDIIHFAIYTAEDCLDILALSHPRLTVLEGY